MRRIGLVAVLLAGAVGMLAALGASGQIPTQDLVVGSGFAAFQYELDASSGPSGENPAGQLTAHTDPAREYPFFDGAVTCLAVRGNVATLNIYDDDPAPGGFVRLTIEITDSGTSGAPDIVEVGLEGRTPENCSPLDNPIVNAPAVSGDFVVVDARPPPTTQRQCVSSGWQTFGFKNQGQCVAFVQRGPRQ